MNAGNTEPVARAVLRSPCGVMQIMHFQYFKKGTFWVGLFGAWRAWPVIRQAGGEAHSSEQFSEYQYPVAHRRLYKCDAVLRFPGASRCADLEMRKAREMGKIIFNSFEEIPNLDCCL